MEALYGAAMDDRLVSAIAAETETRRLSGS